jgi:PAS domain S-box-containing protein
MNHCNELNNDQALAAEAAALGRILLRTEAIAFRWIAAPGWPVDMVSDNVRRWGFDPGALKRGEPPFAELIHPDDLVRVVAEVERHSILGRNRFRQEYRLRNGDGWRWVEDHTWIERGEDGQPLAFNGVLLDVTERKQAELALELAASAVPQLLETEPLQWLIQRVLSRLGLGMGADRVYIFETHSGGAGGVLASQRYEWCRDGIEPQIENPDLQNLEFEEYFPRWLRELRADRAISGAVAEFPLDEHDLLEQQQIQSLIVVPVNLRGSLWGFLGFDAVSSLRHWSSAEERVLRLTAAALGAAIEQERMLEALRQSEQRNRMALEGAGAGAWEWRPGGCSIWSDEQFRLLGLDPLAVQASHETWMDQVHPIDRAWVDAEIRHAFASGAALSIEYRIASDEQLPRWVYTIGRPRLDAEGRVEGLVGILLDIDARKQAQERLRLSAAVIDSTRDGVVVTDLDAHIIAVNRAYCEITGYAEEDLLGKNPRILQSGRHDPQFYLDMWASVIESGHWQGEIWSRRRNGEVYPEWLTVSSVRDEAGRVRHYVGVVTDISRLK